VILKKKEGGPKKGGKQHMSNGGDQMKGKHQFFGIGIRNTPTYGCHQKMGGNIGKGMPLSLKSHPGGCVHNEKWAGVRLLDKKERAEQKDGRRKEKGGKRGPI